MRYRLVLSIGLGLLVTAIGVAGAGEHSRNEDIVRRMVGAINNRDFAALDGLVAADVHRHCAATPGVEVTNLDQFKAFLRQDLSAVPDSRQEIRQLLSDGDMVAARVIYSGTQSGPMGPFPPSGRKLELPFISILRIKNGKVAEIWVEWDNLWALTQLGHWPPPAAAEEDAAKAVARRWFDEVINGRNLDAIPQIYAADYVYHGPGGLELTGLDKVRAFAAAILAASSDRHAVVERQVVEGDRVVTQFVSHGIQTGPYHGIPASGKQWTTEGIVISRIENGRITEEWEVVHNTGLGEE
ncbi:MAG: ester cyclase [Acidobacteria bacterium]|nr:ester cyclase [Acidobacteriota bacterium]